MRPAAIIRFESLWGAMILLGALNMALSWSRTLAMLAATGAFAPLGLTPWVALALIDGLNLAVNLALLLAVTRGRSRIAAELVALLAAYNLWALLLVLLRDRPAGGLTGVLAVAVAVLQLAAAAMLLRPSARAWLVRRGDQPD